MNFEFRPQCELQGEAEATELPDQSAPLCGGAGFKDAQAMHRFHRGRYWGCSRRKQAEKTVVKALNVYYSARITHEELQCHINMNSSIVLCNY